MMMHSYEIVIKLFLLSYYTLTIINVSANENMDFFISLAS